ncbi:MAG: hypothetical protein M1820_001692 [Bogoriella megaspora]|nr:MAG: hypothetical protein M1820_001692 [Bogoriella megaspora]
MPLDGSLITAINTPQSSIPRQLEDFTLYAPPSTDLYRQIPIFDTVTAPILFVPLRHPFTAAEVTVSAKWELEWDQAGFVIFAGSFPTSTVQGDVPDTTLRAAQLGDDGLQHQQINEKDQSPPAYSASERLSKWVKASLEFTNNTLSATSVAATSDGADLTIAPLPPPYYNTHQLQNPIPEVPSSTFPWLSPCLQPRSLAGENLISYTSDSEITESPTNAWFPPARNDLRLKLERIGHALWVWYEDPLSDPDSDDLSWKKLREVSGFFWGVDEKEIRLGITASRPANFGMSVWEREHGGSHFNASTDVENDELGLDSPEEANGADRGLLVRFEDLEIW